jgi:prepilin-type N-terminal cleavage/methylation domain-containing protein
MTQMRLIAPAKHQNGFTLVELLLGLAITAIIGTCVYNMFWTAIRMDDRMRRVHDNYMEVLMADQALTHDLENALSLDFSGNYPDAVIFDGQKTDLSFLTQTRTGIKRVRYYSGFLDQGPVTKSMIGRVVNPLSRIRGYSKDSLPIEFLVRQESSLADWLNGTSAATYAQVVAAGLKKGTFNCHYAPFIKDLHASGAKAIDYKDSWEQKGLPLAVSCSFVLYDYQNPQAGLLFKRDMFLAPVASFHNEQ